MFEMIYKMPTDLPVKKLPQRDHAIVPLVAVGSLAFCLGCEASMTMARPSPRVPFLVSALALGSAFMLQSRRTEHAAEVAAIQTRESQERNPHLQIPETPAARDARLRLEYKEKQQREQGRGR